MSYAANVAPGVYYAGLHRPFFVSRSAVESAARDAGFTDVRWHDRKDAPPVNPRHDPRYVDDWDEWLSARYAGKPRVLELPRRPDWIIAEHAHAVDAKPPPASSSTRTSPNSPRRSVAVGSAIVLLVPIVVLAFRALSRGRR